MLVDMRIEKLQYFKEEPVLFLVLFSFFEVSYVKYIKYKVHY